MSQAPIDSGFAGQPGRAAWPDPYLSLWRRHGLKLALSLAVLSAVLLPANLLSSQRFHHDEALYATWALQISSGVDPWLAHTPVDKPPLFLYSLALALSLLGPTEVAARMPSLLATAFTVVLTFWLGRKLYSVGVGIVAAWLVALSPFGLLFAPTAFTDPMLVAWVLASCLAAVHGRAGWAGLGLGLALATKQQGLFFMPLVLAFLLASPLSRPRRLFSFALSLLFTLLPVLVWQLSRSQTPNFLTHSLSNYGGLGSDPASFVERWQSFVAWLPYATASPLLNGIFLGGLPLLLLFGLKLSHRVPTFQKASQVDWILVLFSLLFLLGHALLSFQAWDRYLLGLIPLLALLLARILWLPWVLVQQAWLNGRPDWQVVAGLLYGLGLAVLLALSLARPVQHAVNGRYPLGSHSQALSGIEQIVAYLQGQAGANHTLYHRWLGAHWRFYLWGYPYDLQSWTSPQELAAKARPGHFIAFPSWQSDTEARLALADAGLRLGELTRAYNPAGYPSLVLYEIVESR